VFAVEDRPGRFLEIAVARDALQLAPRLAAGVTIGADIAATQLTMIGAIRFWAEVGLRVDGAPTASGEGQERRGHAGGLGTRIRILLTRGTERFVDESRKRSGCCGAGSSGLVRLERPVRYGPGMVEPPDMDGEADEHESDPEELGNQQGRCHDHIPFPDGERRRLYWIDSRWNYPLPGGTAPAYRHALRTVRRARKSNRCERKNHAIRRDRRAHDVRMWGKS